jgi:DNA-binding FadR family transcriptional regulator
MLEDLAVDAPKTEREARPALGRNLTFGLFERLGRAIVAGHYEQAALPTEMDLARHYGVSHGVIREAIKMLAAKGLVNARARRGTVVEPEVAWNLLDGDILRWLLERGFSDKLAVRFNELRAAIEPEAAALAAVSAHAGDHARIESALQRVRAARRGRDNGAEALVAFHLAILGAARNPFYTQFQNVLATALRASVPLAGRLTHVADHISVVEAILGDNPDSARQHMRSIVRGVQADLQRIRLHQDD